MSCSKNGANSCHQVQIDWLNDQVISAPKKESKLPVVGERNILITSALPYVNNVPHLGNIIGCVLSADVFARYCRLCNYNSLFICGTDEYGTATETKALQEGLTPREICDKYFKIHESIYDWFQISFDKFGRTSSSEQTEICQEIFLELYKKNYMKVETVEQLKCEKCDRFLADRFVVGTCPHSGCGYNDARGDQCDGCGRLVNAIDLVQPRCNVCATTPVKMNSEQFFFDLPQLEDRLKKWMNDSSKNWSNNARIIGKSYIRDGLKQRCITRDLKWGIPVPLEQYKNKVFYVWFDAPIGYFSITKSLLRDDWTRWWKDSENVELFQFMAKDNVPFHAVLFPATLIGVDQKHTMVSRIMATEYLNYEDGKFSKSRGIGVFGNDAQSTGIEADIWRFYLLYIRPESQDSSFSWSDLAFKNNNELLNNLGNFINRSLSFLEKFFDKSIPEMTEYKDEDWTFIADSLEHIRNYINALENGKLIDGIRQILAISRLGNQYFQANQPWLLIKGDKAQKARAGLVIGICVNMSYHLSVLLSPYMPKTSEKIRIQLNKTNDSIYLNSKNPTIRCVLKTGHKVGKIEPLFTRITDEMITEFKNKFGNNQKTVKTDNKINGAPLSESDLEALQKDLDNQALKVRTLKAQGISKADLQPEIELLLNLKKQLNISTKK